MSGTRAAKIGAPDEDFRGYTATIVRYGVIDDYQTRWRPGVFTRALSEWWPVNTWGHDWRDPIGRMDDVTHDGDDQTDAHFVLDLDRHPDGAPMVPRAWQAHTQLRSGTMRHVSVGFSREKFVVADDDVPEFVEADLDEVGLVARGAVPGAEVTGLRSRMRVSIGELTELAREVEAGRLTEPEAMRALRLLYGSEAPAVPPAAVEEPAGPDAELAEALAEVEAVLG